MSKQAQKDLSNNPIAVLDEAKATAVTVALNQITTEQLAANQLLGRVQAVSAIGKLLGAFSFAQLIAVKEQKTYRHLKGQVMTINGEEVHLDTWDGFCRAIGSSRRTIDEQLQNLAEFGEDALNRAQELGMTTRELRKLRKLNEADQQVVIGELEAAVGDKEAIVELIETMSAKHAKQKAALEKDLAVQKAEAKATARIVEDKNQKIAELEKLIVKQETVSLDEKREQEMLLVVQAEVRADAAIQAYEKQITQALERYPDDEQILNNVGDGIKGLISRLYSYQAEMGLVGVSTPDDSWIDKFHAEKAASQETND